MFFNDNTVAVGRIRNLRRNHFSKSQTESQRVSNVKLTFIGRTIMNNIIESVLVRHNTSFIEVD